MLCCLCFARYGSCIPLWYTLDLHVHVIISAAICVSCQDRNLTSTLREGSHACEGEEVVFTCTVRDSSGLQILVLAWSSDEYIGSGDLLQFTTENMLGTNDTSTIDGNVTATLTRNTIDNGVRILESTLRLVAVQATMVTCDVTNIGQASIPLLISGIYINIYIP